MKRLIFDCSTDIASVAVFDGEKLLAEKSETGRRNHAAILMPCIDDCLNKAGITLKEVDEVYACSGPGSFTGARVGLATALGLCRPVGKKLYVFPYMALVMANELKARGLDKEKKLCLLIDAGRGECYTTLFDTAENKMLDSELLKKDEVEERKKVSETGDGEYSDIVYSGLAKELHAKLFFELPRDIRQAFITESTDPLYFRKSQAEESAEQKKKKEAKGKIC